jgi:hypothetical protein
MASRSHPVLNKGQTSLHGSKTMLTAMKKTDQHAPCSKATKLEETAAGYTAASVH